MVCIRCGSFAINPNLHGRQKGVDLDLCDVCYWRKRAVELHNGIECQDGTLKSVGKRIDDALKYLDSRGGKNYVVRITHVSDILRNCKNLIAAA